MENLSKDDRNVHLQSVIKSNLVGFNLTSIDIDCIVSNMIADILDVLDQFDHLNSEDKHLAN